MKQITINDLPALCLGAAVLGSGGGGDTRILDEFVSGLLALRGPVNVMSVSDLTSNMLVVPLAYIGSPEVSRQRGPNVEMFLAIIETVQRQYEGCEIVLMPAEIGGCNALTPLILASSLSLPVLDADLIGRAFPKVSMCKPAITRKHLPQIAYLGSHSGTCVTVLAKSMDLLEADARRVTTEFGGSASIATFIFSGSDYADYVIEGSLTRAMSLGRMLGEYQQNLPALYANAEATLLGSGCVAEVDSVSEAGFLVGSVKVKSDQQVLTLYFQNEYVCVDCNGSTLAKSPAIIVLLDRETATPIASESLRVGVSVDVLVFSAPPFWLEPGVSARVDLDQFEITRVVPSC